MEDDEQGPLNQAKKKSPKKKILEALRVAALVAELLRRIFWF